MEQYSIKIIRPSGVGPAKVYQVEMDGLQVGALKSKSEVIFATNAGSHTISFLWMGKVEKSVQITIPDGQYVTLIHSKINTWTGKLEVEMGNVTQPIQNTGSYQSNVDYKSANNVKIAGFNQQEKRKKKHGILLAVVACFFWIIVFTVLLASCDSETVDTTITTDTATTDTAKQPAEITNEEKAQKELEKATVKFAEARYEDALKICDAITETYPDTNVANNMSYYIKEQYQQFPHISAKELMSKYEANVVNADEKYTGTVMVVSGTVSSIGKTNHDKNLCVLLRSGTMLWSVQLNFTASQTESVAALQEGDSVTVIGKCTGQSGKQLLVFDGNNVMIERCLLIE